MVRREFIKLLFGLPVLGFLKDKPEGLTLKQLNEAKRQVDTQAVSSTLYCLRCFCDGKPLFLNCVCHFEGGSCCCAFPGNNDGFYGSENVKLGVVDNVQVYDHALTDLEIRDSFPGSENVRLGY